MKKAYKKTAVALLLLLLPLVAQAQFFTAGDDPGCRRWYSIESENYRIIYPRGLDSLARVYAREMERFRKPVGLTSGYLPGECVRGKMPFRSCVFSVLLPERLARFRALPLRHPLRTSPECYRNTVPGSLRNT